MTAAETLKAAHTAGIRLGIDGGDLISDVCVTPPRAALDPENRSWHVLDLMRIVHCHGHNARFFSFLLSPCG